jgi:hypothetical protein
VLHEKMSAMPRQLIWLENNSFAAWGCSDCDWVLPNTDAPAQAEPSAEVQAVFDAHSCNQARYESLKRKE